MTNISRNKRNEMINYLESLKKIHNDDVHLKALNEIENALTEKK